MVFVATCDFWLIVKEDIQKEDIRPSDAKSRETRATKCKKRDWDVITFVLQPNDVVTVFQKWKRRLPAASCSNKAGDWWVAIWKEGGAWEKGTLATKGASGATPDEEQGPDSRQRCESRLVPWETHFVNARGLPWSSGSPHFPLQRL